MPSSRNTLTDLDATILAMSSALENAPALVSDARQISVSYKCNPLGVAHKSGAPVAYKTQPGVTLKTMN